jgi:hypothetical protein
MANGNCSLRHVQVVARRSISPNGKWGCIDSSWWSSHFPSKYSYCVSGRSPRCLALPQMILSASQSVHWRTARIQCMCRLNVELSPELDRTQRPYQAVYRAPYSGPKENLVMVYRFKIKSLSLISEGGTFATIHQHGSSHRLAGRCDVSLLKKEKAIMQP